MPNPYALPIPRDVGRLYPGHFRALWATLDGLDEDTIDRDTDRGESLTGALEDLIDGGFVKYSDGVYSPTVAGRKIFWASVRGVP